MAQVSPTHSGSSTSSTSSSTSSGAYAASTTDVGNLQAANILIWIFAGIIVVVAGCKLVGATSRSVRHLACLNNEKQGYFRYSARSVALLKKHLLDAPLFRTRHHHELRLFSSAGMGVLPTRLQSLLITAIIGVNVALAVQGIEWYDVTSVNTLKHLRNRTGTLAVMDMIPLVIMAGRNNPLIYGLGVSFDTFNLVHRWIGRACAGQAIAHTAAFLATDYYKLGWAATWATFRTSNEVITGVVALGAFVVINVQALAFIRHAYYELFLHLHILLAATAIGGLWYHLAEQPTQMTYLILVIAAWISERVVRLLRIAYRNFGGRGRSRATIEALPGNAVRVTLTLARPWTVTPGQYMFITIPSIGLWTSHPFSVAWSEEEFSMMDERGLVTTPTGLAEKGFSAITQRGVLAQANGTTISALIRGREGFTRKVFRKAFAAENKTTTVSAIVEGPYGTSPSLRSYGTVVLFAGGVGITHHVPYLRQLVEDYAHGMAAVQRVCLVWTVQSPEHLEWIRPWLAKILALDRRRDVLRIQIFVTRPRSGKDIQSPSDMIQMFPGRPSIPTLLEKEVAAQVGAMAVSVCGTGSLADDVRRAVRKFHGTANIDLLEESFSW